MLFRFIPSEAEIAHSTDVGFATVGDMRWYAWLNLVWSVFILTTPWVSEGAYPHWAVPTLSSFAVFLWLYYRTYFRRDYGHGIVGYGLAMAALGYVVTPFNPGAQTYLIYAIAFFAVALNTRQAVRLSVLILALFALEWYLLGFDWMYSLSALVIGPVVGCMNLVYKRNHQRNAELKLTHDEVRRLAALAERERIGRDLHDLLGHTLALITLKSELANKLFDRDAAAARREIADVERVARDALAQVRRAVTGIRAAGLAAEMASAKLLLESNGISLDCDLGDIVLPTDIETALAMTMREAVTNIQRHAQAPKARIRLRAEENLLVLRIEDSGRGGAIVPGNGLTGMRERLAGIGAQLRVDSERGRGTRLCVTMPLPEMAKAEPVPVANLRTAGI
jgi:two-component system, NarL family, sensor histidine kinase DesK